MPRPWRAATSPTSCPGRPTREAPGLPLPWAGGARKRRTPPPAAARAGEPHGEGSLQGRRASPHGRHPLPPPPNSRPPLPPYFSYVAGEKVRGPTEDFVDGDTVLQASWSQELSMAGSLPLDTKI
jgi:hypothetical protein